MPGKPAGQSSGSPQAAAASLQIVAERVLCSEAAPFVASQVALVLISPQVRRHAVVEQPLASCGPLPPGSMRDFLAPIAQTLAFVGSALIRRTRRMGPTRMSLHASPLGALLLLLQACPGQPDSQAVDKLFRHLTVNERHTKSQMCSISAMMTRARETPLPAHLKVANSLIKLEGGLDPPTGSSLA